MNLLPDLFAGPLRLGSQPDTLGILLGEPLLFATHFATIEPLITLPTDLDGRLESIRERYSAHDEVLELMDTLRGQVAMPLSIELTRRMAEGMELHGQVRQQPERWQALCRDGTAKLERLLEAPADHESEELSPAGRLQRLARLMEFSVAETRILGFALGLTLSPALQCFTRLFVGQRRTRNSLWQTLLDLPLPEIHAALATRGRLTGSGLLQEQEGIPHLAEFWTELLVNTALGFDEQLVQPLPAKETPDGAGRLPPVDRQILCALLVREEPGINVLLHGKASVDKLGLARALVDDVKGTAYGLVPDIPDGDRPAALLVAQRLLSRYAGTPILVVEKAAAILSRQPWEGLLFFGLGDVDEEAQPLDEHLLLENPLPTLWLTHEAKRLHPESLTLFLFHAEVLPGTRAERSALVESMINALPLGSREKTELAKLEGLSARQLISASVLAKMTAGRSKATFSRHLLTAAQRSQKALARRSRDNARLPLTQYSVDYVHAAGRFGPQQILQALKRRPQGSLCLYGLPGTGKTQYAEHVAQELGKPILIKPASELFDKYVGESEKRIASAFDQAEEEGAILLLDEADSFLRDRQRSEQSWQVSTVNEVLQHMERFEEILICTTNLYSQLDSAALRRFTFKLEFLPLTFEQRWQMFLNESGLRGKTLAKQRKAAFEDRLALMQDLTPGDFATVKRQCVLLGEDLSPEDWLGQLEMEIRAKARPASGEGSGVRA
ncbi:MAG: ATP-binding protein [Thauera sp.]|jgi:hypothetical protein|nr:ATP-binding protein [Thauera sp.]